VGVVVPANAFARSLSVNCETLTYAISGYPADGNTFTYTIDGYKPATIRFGSALKYRIVFDDLGGSDKAHTWKFVIDAVGSSMDRTISGTSAPTCR
jgi:hypothetical protein